MAKTGRPTTYSDAIADAICEDLATTDHALHRICEREGMSAALHSLPVAHPPFGLFGEIRARTTQADFLAAQVIEIAETVREGKQVRVSQKDGITQERGGEMVDRPARGVSGFP